jgi:hypothetical protein
MDTKLTTLAARSMIAIGAALLLVACAAETDGMDDEGDLADTAESSDDALTTSPTSVRLLYEGTCDFLHNCSSWSRRLPDDQVQWGCGGTACSDTEHWVAGPSRSYCGKKIKVCKGSRCTTATVKDISNVHGWEASNGVMDAIGLSHTVNVEACSGAGGGRVTVALAK